MKKTRPTDVSNRLLQTDPSRRFDLLESLHKYALQALPYLKLSTTTTSSPVQLLAWMVIRAFAEPLHDPHDSDPQEEE